MQNTPFLLKNAFLVFKSDPCICGNLLNRSKDASALDELKRLGAMTTPVTLIGSETIIGFDPEKIDKALAIS